MEHLFESGRIVDFILAGVAVESLVLLVWLRRTGGNGTSLAANLAAGACLLLAVRAALSGADWVWPAFWLALALPAHLVDVVTRVARAKATPEAGTRKPYPPRRRSA